MTHYLFVMWEGGGSVPPELGLARRLIARGHRVTVLGDDCLQPEVVAIGASFRGYERAPNRRTKDKADDPVQDWTFANPLAGLKSAVNNKMCGPALEVAQDVLAVHESDRVDVIVGCSFLFGVVAAAEKLALPVVELFPNVDFRPAPGRPAPGAGLTPMRGILGRLRDRLFNAVGGRVFDTGLPAVNRARRELGVPEVRTLFEVYDRVTANLLLTSAAFEFPYELPERTFFVGPVLDDPHWAADWTPPWAPGDERPLVLASYGSSFQDQHDVYQRTIDALAGLDVRGIVTLGGVWSPDDFRVPDGVVVVESAPHQPILAQADVALIHCGHGSAVKTLAAGVPAVCIPLGRDQPDNAARIAWHGAGVKLSPKAKTAAIAAAVRKLLDEPQYRDAARKLGEAIRSEAARDLAVDHLERVATAGPGVPRNRASVSPAP